MNEYIHGNGTLGMLSLCEFSDFRESNILKTHCAMEIVLCLAEGTWLLPDY